MIKRFGTLMLGCMLAFTTAFALAGCATQDYKPEEKSPTVSPDTIIEAGVLRVGVTAENNTPFAGQASGKIVGLDVDIAAALADNLGLKLEIVDVGTDVDTALENKQVDIVMGVDKTSTQVTCWRSEVYVESAVALFAAPATTAVPTKDSAPTIAAQSSSMSAWEVTNQFGEDALDATTDLKGAFEAVSSGTASYAAADAVIGTYAANASEIDVHIVALMQTPSGYSVGVLDTNTDLKTAVSDALATLSGGGVISLIESKWLGTSIDLSAVPMTEGAVRATTGTATDESESGEGADAVAGGEAEGQDTAPTEGEGESQDEQMEPGSNAVQQPGATS
ncbi:substrate-binding periplasmic protein [Raoultibacter phocaeensis]|uniref:substrate-binding periplasmic protein n=1 Tax=Raoultibacter phocaeensis TaxID=2479841 RepID=UPI002104E568|nr:transporter substrate-binding domain-containing protein [Raoultibacter phocaeensis]